MTQDPNNPTPLPLKHRLAATLGAVLGMATGIAAYKLIGFENSWLFPLFFVVGGSIGIILAHKIVSR